MTPQIVPPNTTNNNNDVGSQQTSNNVELNDPFLNNNELRSDSDYHMNDTIWLEGKSNLKQGSEDPEQPRSTNETMESPVPMEGSDDHKHNNGKRLDERDDEEKRLHCDCGVANVPKPLLLGKWLNPDANAFVVRGESYLTDKKKVNAGKSMFDLIAIDILEVPKPLRQGVGDHPNERMQQALIRESRGENVNLPPFVLIINIMIPGPPFYHLVMYYAVDDVRKIDGTDGSPFSHLANKFFFGNSDEFRDNTFKLIPRIVEGNFLVKRAVGSNTPAIMGTKLDQHYVRDKNSRFFELILDVGSSTIASNVVRLAIGYSETLVVDIAFLLEGKDATTLPERIMGCCRLKNIDMINDSRFSN